MHFRMARYFSHAKVVRFGSGRRKCISSQGCIGESGMDASAVCNLVRRLPCPHRWSMKRKRKRRLLVRVRLSLADFAILAQVQSLYSVEHRGIRALGIKAE